ncbi:MAG: aromatic ring-hydroxylating dioxygenase subunit alpha [Anaerolineaceae bacterium]|nr:aromatic ring-hydroxylating dioxygenase subunit alpha [Anaerolineaceae bacterium]
MIPNQWYVILESRQVKKRKPVGFTRMGEKMVAWRNINGKVIIQSDVCPHRGAALHQGKIQNNHVMCPFHGFEFDSSGVCQYIPANGKNATPPKILHAKTYRSVERHGYIFIWWGQEQDTYPDVPIFEKLESGFHYADYKECWNIHYSRAIENQLDVFHLPFPHRTTIGRGNRTIADGPIVKIEEDEMKIWVHNRIDDGVSAKRASELPEPSRPPFLHFRFPHLWQNHISDDMRITVYFTPIDDENTMMYTRYYQSFVKIPILGQFISWMTSVFSIIILHQDKRVVEKQIPIMSDLKMSEKLIPADQPIILYRRIRKELQEK